MLNCERNQYHSTYEWLGDSCIACDVDPVGRVGVKRPPLSAGRLSGLRAVAGWAGRVSSHGEPPKILIPSSFPTIQYGALGFRPELVGCMGRFFSVIRFATGLEGSKNLWSFLYVARNKPFVKRCINTIYNINEAL